MIKPTELRDHVIQPTLSRMAYYYKGISSPAAVNLLIGTAVHESTIGNETYLRQRGDGPAKGIYQIERATEQSIFNDHLKFAGGDRQNMVQELAIHRANGVAGGSTLDLCGNLPYQTAIARLIYWYREFTWPSDPTDVEALGMIWKRCYNTHLGKGTVEQFVEHFPREVLDT